MKQTRPPRVAGRPRRAVTVLLALTRARGLRLGPQGCVSLLRSDAGSCVIKTLCKGIDTNKFEFALNCWNPPSNIVRHSFGFGGFDVEEEFDTGIRCERCEAPAQLTAASIPDTVAAQMTPAQVAGGSPSARLARQASTIAQVEAVAPENIGAVSAVAISPILPPAAHYGPGKCVATWRDSQTGHCIMRTKCTEEEMSNYEYGLICLDQEGEPIKHLFGKGSFDPEETFDTLLVCAECDGADGPPARRGSNIATSGIPTMNDIRDDVAELKGQFQKMTNLVEALNKEVLNNASNQANGTAGSSLLHMGLRLRGHRSSRRSGASSQSAPPAVAVGVAEVAEDSVGDDVGGNNVQPTAVQGRALASASQVAATVQAIHVPGQHDEIEHQLQHNATRNTEYTTAGDEADIDTTPSARGGDSPIMSSPVMALVPTEDEATGNPYGQVVDLGNPYGRAVDSGSASDSDDGDAA